MLIKKIFFKTHYYNWSGISNEGRRIHGEIQAISLNMATVNLTQQGITPVLIRKKRTYPSIKTFWTRLHYKQSFQKISSVDILVFFRQLSALITAGIPLTQGLAILMQGQENLSLRTLIQTVKMELETGKTLSQALRKQAVYFDALTCHLIHLAEQTGTLDIMLTRIAHYKEKSHVLKTKIKQALFYPILILVVAVMISIILLIVVIPRFEELFQSFHHTLPGFTLMILQLSHCIRHYYGWCVIPIIMTLLGVHWYKKSLSLKQRLDTGLFKLPLIGHLIQKVLLARFARTLATVLAAGLILTDALTLLATLSDNYLYRQALQTLQFDIASGQRLHHAMLTKPLFTPILTQMVKVGEESGSLERMLEKVADFYEADIDYWVANFSQLLEPLIILILGVLIGGLVIAMYLPIFKLGTVI